MSITPLTKWLHCHGWHLTGWLNLTTDMRNADPWHYSFRRNCFWEDSGRSAWGFILHARWFIFEAYGPFRLTRLVKGRNNV
jgi:hypothetical protein